MPWTLCSIAALALFATGGAADAQTTLPYDHVHLAAPDQAAAVEWYRKNLGGQLSAEGKDRVTFGKTRFIFLKDERRSRARARRSITSASRSPTSTRR